MPKFKESDNGVKFKQGLSKRSHAYIHRNIYVGIYPAVKLRTGPKNIQLEANHFAFDLEPVASEYN